MSLQCATSFVLRCRCGGRPGGSGGSVATLCVVNGSRRLLFSAVGGGRLWEIPRRRLWLSSTRWIRRKEDRKLPPVKPSWFLLKRLFGLAKPVKKRIGVGILLLTISSSVTISVPFLMGRIIDSIFVQHSGDKSALDQFLFLKNKDRRPSTAVPTPPGVDVDVGDVEGGQSVLEQLGHVCLVFVVIFTIGAMANSGRIYCMRTAGQRVVNKLRTDTFSNVIRQEVAFFDHTKTGELMNRLSNDAYQVGGAVTQNVSDGLRAFATACGGVGMMFYVSPPLTLLGVMLGPPIALVAVKFGQIVSRLTQQMNNALAEASEVAEERFSNVKTIRAFGTEKKESALYAAKVEAFWRLVVKEAGYMGVTFGFFGWSGNLFMLAILYQGGQYVATGAMTIGELSSFLLYALYVGVSVGGLTGFYTELMRGLGASARLFELIERPAKIPISGGLRLDSLMGEVRFLDIHFAFPSRSEAIIFNGLSLTIPGGKTTAIVGPSGSGKSTLALLALRLYDPASGTVCIDGQDVKTLDLSWLRKHVATVSQDPVLFSATIRENIAYGVTTEETADGGTISVEQLEEAARRANALDFIRQFPEGFDTIVGERGAALSGGQRQRVAIARALLLNPKLLILDEATSALDAESEYMVRRALDNLLSGTDRTVMIIAHRLSTVRNADQIAVLGTEQQGVVELGTYDELMAIDEGVFKALVDKQTVQWTTM